MIPKTWADFSKIIPCKALKHLHIWAQEGTIGHRRGQLMPIGAPTDYTFCDFSVDGVYPRAQPRTLIEILGEIGTPLGAQSQI